MKMNERTGNFISVLAVYFAANVIFIMSPAMNSIATNLYPDIEYGTVLMLSTISSLFMIPGSLLAGAVLGKKIGFKQMAVIGSPFESITSPAMGSWLGFQYQIWFPSC